MRDERLIVSRLVTEMMNFFFSMGAKNISAAVEKLEDRYQVTLESDYAGSPTGKIREMTRMLRMPRAREMEEYSWSLSGDVSTGQEIYLVGILTDEVSVEHDEEAGRVKIVLTRLFL
ncbi:MAG: hypothetical protein GX791_04115 [Synergistaceae bacterium]|nr:hypothetical protein [Synergistaceae bacterium]